MNWDGCDLICVQSDTLGLGVDGASFLRGREVVVCEFGRRGGVRPGSTVGAGSS